MIASGVPPGPYLIGSHDDEGSAVALPPPPPPPPPPQPAAASASGTATNTPTSNHPSLFTYCPSSVTGCTSADRHATRRRPARAQVSRHRAAPATPNAFWRLTLGADELVE